MSHLADPFPDCISFDALGGPGYNTSITMTDGGWEQRIQNWESSRCEYDVAHAVRKQEYAKQLLVYYRRCRGRFNTFNFKDPLDFSVPDNQGTGIFVALDDGGSPLIRYQAYKRYATGKSEQEDRKITRLKQSITVTGGTVSSIDYDTGIVRMTSGTPTSWTGDFYVPCRFDTDLMQQRLVGKNLTSGYIVGWEQIKIVEVRE